MLLKSIHDPMTNLGCSDTNCCAQDNNPSEESTNQTETDATGDVPNTHKNGETIKKIINIVFNEVRQFAYILGTREREILLIQQSIQTNTKGYLRELSEIQYMRALSLIYSHRVPRI